MAMYHPFERPLTPAELDAWRTAQKRDKIINAVRAIRSLPVQQVRDGDSRVPGTTDPRLISKEPSGRVFDWADDETLARDTKSPEPQLGSVAIGSNTLLFLTALPTQIK